MYKITFRRVRTSLELRESYKPQKLLLALSFFIGVISSVPGVYASYTFNNDSKKFLAIIILFGNVGLATLGFYLLMFEVWDRSKTDKNDPAKRFYNNLTTKYFKLLQYYNQNE